MFCIPFVLCAIMSEMKEQFIAILPEIFLKHSMPCLNNQWNGKVGHIFKVHFCAIFTMYKWSIVLCFFRFEKDFNALLSTFLLIFCLCYLFQKLNHAMQVFWPFIKVAFKHWIESIFAENLNQFERYPILNNFIETLRVALICEWRFADWFCYFVS